MTIRTSILLCSVSAAACMVAAPSQAQNRMFDIPAQAAITAIPEFARQAQLQVVAPARELNGVRTPTVKGAMDTRQALRRLIKGTPLRIATDDGHVITLRAAANRADAETINTSAPEAHAAGEDIVVTGTRIVRDGYQAPTPTTVLGQEEIQRRASTNIADQLGLLPAFAASTNPRNSASNISGGIMGINALNLRGLGQTRTLVLLDGQRLPAGTLSGWVDINTVPNALIKRVDIVTGVRRPPGVRMPSRASSTSYSTRNLPVSRAMHRAASPLMATIATSRSRCRAAPPLPMAAGTSSSASRTPIIRG
jgi:iron complex outermembrane receptor protein